jgi:hypothetical protein
MRSKCDILVLEEKGVDLLKKCSFSKMLIGETEKNFLKK